MAEGPIARPGDTASHSNVDVERERAPITVVNNYITNSGNTVLSNVGSEAQINVDDSATTSTDDCGVFMKKPMLLVSKENDKLVYIKETIEALRKISLPLVLVSIVGPYRTGKSYLMNRLVSYRGQFQQREVSESGFVVGHTLDSQTKGIWVWAVMHPIMEDTCLLVLDTEGLGDPGTGDENHDHKIFALALLNSSHFILNTRGPIEQRHISLLDFVTNITEKIHLKANDSSKSRAVNETDDENDVEDEDGVSGDDDDDDEDEDEDESEEDDGFQQWFPLFTWVMRDQTLTLVWKNKPVTAAEYLEHCLAERKIRGSDSGTQQQEKFNYNLPRKQIKKYFQKRTCFALVPPSNPCGNLNASAESDQDEFMKGIEECCKYVLESSPIKTIVTDTKKEQMKGSGFADIVIALVDQMSKPGTVPCVENAVKTMEELSNNRAIEQAVKFYEEQMNTAPMPSKCSKLSKKHEETELKSISLFEEHKIFDKAHEYLNKLKEKLEQRYAALKNKNQREADRKAEAGIKSSVQHYTSTLEGYMKNKILAPWEFEKKHEEVMKSARTLFKDTIQTFDEEGVIMKKFENELCDSLTEEHKKLHAQNQTEEQIKEKEHHDKTKKISEQYNKELGIWFQNQELPIDEAALRNFHAGRKAAKLMEFKAHVGEFHKAQDVCLQLEKKMDKVFGEHQSLNKMKALEQKNEHCENELKRTREKVQEQEHQLEKAMGEVEIAKNELVGCKEKVDILEGQLEEMKQKQISFRMRNKETNAYLIAENDETIGVSSTVNKKDPECHWYFNGNKIMSVTSKKAVTIGFPSPLPSGDMKSKYAVTLQADSADSDFSKFQEWNVKLDKTYYLIQSQYVLYKETWMLRATEKKFKLSRSSSEKHMTAYAEQKAFYRTDHHWILDPLLS